MNYQSSHRTTKVADDFSTEYEFEDIEIEEDGIHFGSFWGTAELALNDPRDGDFFVKHVTVNGTMRQRQFRGGYELLIMKRVDAVMQLPLPAKDDQTFKAHLFRKIEAALYASRDAQDHFQDEVGNA